VSPLSLADGGLVVATQSELVALDAEGNVRARAAVDPEDELVHAIVGIPGTSGPTVYALTASGAVVSWIPAAGCEVGHVGTFGGATDGGMAASGPTLVAVVGAELVTLDPSNGRVTTRPAGAVSGALALLGPPSVHGDVVSLIGLTPTRTVVLAFDATGAETLHQAVGPSMLPPLQDGGVGLGSIPPHVGTLVDPQGDVAFALSTGELGVVSTSHADRATRQDPLSGSLDVMSEVCTRAGAPASLASLGIHGGPTYVGLAPAAPYAMIVACGAGVVARIDSDFAPAP
jgi:hypothetical protein